MIWNDIKKEGRELYLILALIIGIIWGIIRYPADLEEKKLLNKINELNKNDKISGILDLVEKLVYQQTNYLPEVLSD